MPNPFYQCYAAAALGGGRRAALRAGDEARPAFCPISPACRSDCWSGMAAVYICSPSNPEGAVRRARPIGETLFALAERHDFIVLADECYADIYFEQAAGQRADGAASAERRLRRGCSPSIPCPSARACRACAPAWWRAMPKLIEKFRAFRNVAGPKCPRRSWRPRPPPGATRTMSTANRAAYHEKMAAAERILGNRMRAARGRLFPLARCRRWRGIRAARLWREAGGPGAARRLYGPGNSEPGKTQSNPGFSYVRVALVNDLSTIMAALERTGRNLCESGECRMSESNGSSE